MVAVSKLSRKDLEQEIGSYISHLFLSESYHFNIEVGVLDIPDEVYHYRNREEVSRLAETEVGMWRLSLIEQIKAEFPWIEDWERIGRSGGWLILKPQIGVLDKRGDSLHLKDTRRRLRDLRTIYDQIQQGLTQLHVDFHSIDFWAALIPEYPRSRKAWDPRKSR